MKRSDNKSGCPVNCSLEAFGDPWSLLIVRDIIYYGKRTYGEFLGSPEGIATNILAARLAHMEQGGILIKQPHPTDGRKEIYSLTEKGLDLIPVLLEMSGWSARHDPHAAAPQELAKRIYADRDAMFRLVRETVQEGGAVFTGPDSVISKLNISSDTCSTS